LSFQKMRENDKPKKPATAFLRYLNDAAAKNPRQPNQTHKEHIIAVADKWNKMPEDQKKTYSDAALSERNKYKQEIAKWELKMIRLGNIDLVREKTLIEERSEPKSRPRKPRARAVSSDSD
jgi:hypothetical protein